MSTVNIVSRETIVMAKSSKATYHHGDLRSALMSAALAHIKRHGASTLSLRSLARGVGVAHSAAYRHFRSRDDVLAAIAEEGFRQLHDVICAAAASSPSDPMAALRATGFAYVDFAVAHRHHMQVMFGDLIRDKKRYSGLADCARQTAERMSELVHAARVSGAYRPRDERLMGLASWSMVHGLAMLIIAGQVGETASEAADRRTVVEAVLGLLREGLAEPKPQA